MEGLDARRGQGFHGRRDRPVDALRTGRAAGDNERWPVLVQPQQLTRRLPCGGAVQRGDFPAHRHADVPGPAEFRAGEGNGNVAAEAGAYLVGQAGPGVGFMDNDGDVAPPGGEVERRAHVAADAHQDVGFSVVEDFSGLPDRTGQPSREPQQIKGRLARKRHAADGGQFQAGRRNQPGLHPAGRSHGQEAHLRAHFPQRGRYGQEGTDVPRRSAAGEDY